MANQGVFRGSWQDEGIFFTLVVQGGVGLIFLLLIFIFNKNESLAKVLRPARPHSRFARFMTRRDTAALFERDENEVAMRVSVFSALQLLILKYRTHIFLGGFVSAACLLIIFGTDTFLGSYAFRYDTYDCKSRASSDDCTKSGVCAWNGTACAPVRLEGLSDLTLLNVTPTHFRSWLIGIFTVIFHVWFGYCVIKMMVEMRVLIFSAKTMPVQLQSERLALVAKSGSRSVRVGGISDEQCRAFNGSASSLFAKQIQRQEQEQSSVEGQLPELATSAKLASVASLLQPSHAVETVVVYQPPEAEDGVPLTDLILEENEAIEQLNDYLARKKAQDEGHTEQAGVSCCCGNCSCLGVSEDDIQSARAKVKEIQERIKKLQSPASKYAATASATENPLASVYAPWKVTEATAAIITFDTSANAHKFAQLVPTILKKASSDLGKSDVNSETEIGTDSTFSAEITGPASHVLYSGLAPASFGNACKTAALLVIYVAFIFFASAIVAFFGSIESLASIPGLGHVFGVVVDKIPITIFRILQAYLPVVIVAIFQMAIPVLMRAIADSLRFGNWEAREASTFRFTFVYVFMTAVILQTALQGGIFQLAGLVARASVTDVMNFLVSIFTPKGGYFFALVASSAVWSMLMQVLCIGFLFSSVFVAPHEATEEKRRANEKPRPLPFDITSALWMLMFALGVLFHSTSPLLLMFVTGYFVTAYYSFRSVILDGSSRDAKSDPAVDTTLSCTLAASQVKVMLLLHTLACVGTFALFIFKFLWGAAALTSVTFLINLYLWSVKWNTLDPMLSTTDLIMIDHYDHLLSRRKRSSGDQPRQGEFLPPFVRSYKFVEDGAEKTC